MRFFRILFGNIKLGRFSFSTSGSLFVGIVAGWLIVRYIHTIGPESELFDAAQNILSKDIVDKRFFDLFLVLFIASVGLLAARMWAGNKKIWPEIHNTGLFDYLHRAAKLWIQPVL